MPRNYADHANSMLIMAASHPHGSLQRSEALTQGLIYSNLALRDAILEAAATLKFLAGERAERNGAG